MDKNIKKNVKNYDRTVDEYIKNTCALEPLHIEIRNEFLTYIHQQGKILDICCGPGRDSQFFSELGYSVLGIDLSEKMIEKARIVAPKAKFMIMDFTALRLEENLFDGIWFEAGLLTVEKRYHVPTLNRIYSLLKDTGIFYVSLKEGKGEGFELDKRYGVERYYSYYVENEMKRLLEKCEFGIVKIGKPAFKSAYHTHQWMCFLCKKKKKT